MINIHNSKTHRRNIQKAVKETFDISAWKNPTAVTLTFRKVRVFQNTRVSANPDICSQNLRHFLNLLNKKAYRNRARRMRIPCYNALEPMQDGRYHYHLALDRPEHISEAIFELSIKRFWSKTHWGYLQVKVDHNCDEGWIDYLVKVRSKSHYSDAFDWFNVSKLQTSDEKEQNPRINNEIRNQDQQLKSIIEISN